MSLATRGSSAVLAGLTVAALAGSFLLTSPPRISHEEAIPFSPGSPLKFACTLLACNYALATPQGVAIKQLVFHLALAAAAAIVVLGAAFARRGQPWLPPATAEGPAPAGWWQRLDAPTSAQLLLGLMAVWALAAIGWSHAPKVTWGSAALLVLGIAWAVLVAHGLRADSAKVVAVGLVAAATLTAAVGIWYHYQRLPTQRLGYPIGNPLFLGACLIPPILLTLSATADRLRRLARSPRATPLIALAFAVVALGVMGYAFGLAESRGPLVGLAAGLVTLALLALPRRWAPPAAAGIVVVGLIVGGLYARGQLSTPDYSRSATLRARLYAWQAAGELARNNPLVGFGPGIFPLLANDLLVEQRIRDPAVLAGSELAHAHSEPLELLTEYGAVGLALILIAIALTVWASWQGLGRAVDGEVGWLLKGSLAALVALLVEECADVALRQPPLPIVFWTILGMNWHLARATMPLPTPGPRVGSALVPVLSAAALAVGAGGAWIGWRDFQGARAAAVAQYGPGDPQQAEPIEVWPTADMRRVRAADQAAATRTDTFRRVQAMVLQLITRNQLAAAAIETARQRVASTTQPQELARDGAIEELMRLARRQVDEVLLLAEHLNATAQGIMGVGRSEADAAAMGMLLAGMSDDRQDMQRYQLRRWQALARERRVQPFDPELLLQIFAEPAEAPAAVRVAVLRDTLRAPLPPDVLWQMVRDLDSPAFRAGLAELLEQAEQCELENDPRAWSDPLAPETLRLAGMSAWARFQPQQAIEYADRARGLYELAGDRFHIQQAVTLLERARYVWYAQPDQPLAALVNYQDALSMLPDSYVGRQVGEHYTGVYLGVLLSCGAEQKARELLSGWAADEELDAATAGGYWSIVRAMLQVPPDQRSPAVRTWIERVEQLAPDLAGIPMARAQLAAEEQDFQEAVRQWRLALAGGVPSRSVLFFVQQFRGRYPDSKTLAEYEEELLATTRPTTRPATD